MQRGFAHLAMIGVLFCVAVASPAWAAEVILTPEPSTFLLLSAAFSALGVRRSRRPAAR